jgi:putative addiction module killer protein
MIEVLEAAPYSAWFKGLKDQQARARIIVRIRRLSLGNFGDVRPIGDGLSELRVHYGPG